MANQEDQRERLLTEAEARVTWGEPPEVVVEELINKGMNPQEAVTVTAGLVHQRNREVRARSLRRLMTGGGMVFAVGFFFTVLPWREWYDWLVQLQDDWGWRGWRRRSSLAVLMVLVVIAIGVAGMWQMWRGFRGFLTPQSEELTDVE